MVQSENATEPWADHMRTPFLPAHALQCHAPAGTFAILGRRQLRWKALSQLSQSSTARTESHRKGRAARPYKSAVENRFVMGNAKAA